jgi:hypothetical protein
MEGFERRDAGGQDADARGEGSALVMNVDAETAERVADEAEVDGLLLVELIELPRLEEREDVGADIVGVQGRAAGGDQVSIDAEHRGRAGDEKDVGGAPGGGVLE